MPITRYKYRCIDCNHYHEIDQPHYVCSQCRGLLLIERDLNYIRAQFPDLATWRQHYETLRALPRSRYPFGSGVFRWLGLILPGFPLEHVVSLNEGDTDLWEPPDWLKRQIGLKRLYVKLEGQAPSGSFKDRGMPIPVSDGVRLKRTRPELGIKYVCCASTGDTSASAALYAAYLGDKVASAVLLPQDRKSVV